MNTRTLSLFLATLAMGILPACRRRTFGESGAREFRPVTISETEEGPGRLPFAKAAAGLTDDQIIALRHVSVLGNLRSTEIRLRNLQPEQANALRRLYSTAGVAWSVTNEERLSGTDVSLYDFMPPLVQASVGLVFEQSEENTAQLHLEMKEKGVADYPASLKILANCWGTAWEFLRLARAPRPTRPSPGQSLGTAALFYAHPDILASFRKPEHSTLVKAIPSPGKLNLQPVSPDAGLGLSPGDALLLVLEPGAGGPEQLLHVAIVADEGLYFEKVGAESHALYRMSYLEDILSMYGEAAQGRVKLEWRRFSGAPLPHPAMAFASPVEGAPAQVPALGRYAQTVGYRVFDVGMVFDGATGRAQFEPAAFQKASFFADSSCGRDCVLCRVRVRGEAGDAEFEIPRISEIKETIALLPRNVARETGDLGAFPPDGILLRKSGPRIWTGHWGGRDWRVEHSGNRVDATLEIQGIGKSSPEMCRRQ